MSVAFLDLWEPAALICAVDFPCATEIDSGKGRCPIFNFQYVERQIKKRKRERNCFRFLPSRSSSMGNCMRKERASIPAAEGSSGNPTIQNPSEEAARSGMDGIDHEQLPAVARGPSLAMTLSLSHHEFMREVLERATNGFSDSNFLGKGGFGSVHKGLLEDGRTVAIKQLGVGSSQGDREFLSEVEIITRVHHRHLVSLVGYCIANAARMLVYEFVPNNTLKYHLHEKGEPNLDWPTRLKIAVGSAKGLAYLHEDCHPKIIHRDVKSDNILLDENFVAKIADFGLARIFPDDKTHVDVTHVAGTIGYLDPEYASTGELTDKSDVYSFGVILLELVTGMKSLFRRIGFTRSTPLVAWGWRNLERRNYEALVDVRLRKNYNMEELARVVECAYACVQVSSKCRPRMIQVVRVLEGYSSIDSLEECFKYTSSPDHENLINSAASSSQPSRSTRRRQSMTLT